jgi:hypothetical protein
VANICKRGNEPSGSFSRRTLLHGVGKYTYRIHNVTQIHTFVGCSPALYSCEQDILRSFSTFPKSVHQSAFTAHFVNSRNCTLIAEHEGKTHSKNFHFEEKIILIRMLKWGGGGYCVHENEQGNFRPHK